MPANELIITIKSQISSSGIASTQGTATAVGKEKQERSAFAKIVNWNDEIKDIAKESLSPTAYMVVSNATSLAIKSAKQYINYYVSDIGRQNGDSNYQAQVQNRIDTFTDWTSTIGQGLSGAVSGLAIGGIPGAVVGGIIGVGTNLINISYRKQNEQRQFQYQMFKDSQSQAYNLARAGNALNVGRPR